MIHDLTDPAFLRDPAPALARIRAEGPLAETRLPFIGRIRITTTDAAARALLKSPDFLRDPGSEGGRPLASRYWWMPPTLRPLLGSMLGTDGARHHRLRGLVEQAFARSEMEALAPAIRELASGLLDRIDPGGETDLIGAYARPLPLAAICLLMGIPEADRDRVARWIAPISGPTTALGVLRALPGLRRLMRHFRADFAAQRRAPRPGLIGALVEARDGDDRLSEDELLAMVVVLFIAGHETTVHLIGNALAGILGDDRLRHALRDDAAGLPLMVEEFMRHASPVMMSKPHFAARDMEFLGTPLRKGDQVAALLIGANRDPARHESPDSFVPDRRPNAHLGFGHGPHVCLGMQLARIEAREAIAALLTRFPAAELTRAPPHLRRAGIRGFESLPARLGAAKVG